MTARRLVWDVAGGWHLAGVDRERVRALTAARSAVVPQTLAIPADRGGALASNLRSLLKLPARGQ